MSRFDKYRIDLMDGTSETLYGRVEIYENVIKVVEEYGVTGGVKGAVTFPLANVKSWRKVEQ